MKSGLFFSAIMLSFSVHSALHAQSLSRVDSSASCVANWRLGDTKTYSIVHEKYNNNAGKKAPPFKFAYRARVSVIDSSKSGYTIKWVFHLPADMSGFPSGLGDSLPVYNGMQMLFRITDMGAFIELLNWEEVRDAYTKMMELSLPKKMDSTTSAIIRNAKEMFNSKSMVESTLIKEIRLFHMPYGYRFTTNEVGNPTEIDNPFGGRPFPAIQTTRVHGVGSDKEDFMIAFDLFIDKANGKAMMDSIFKRLNIEDNPEVHQGKEIMANFDMHDFSEYRIINSNGWIRSLRYKRTFSIPGITQLDEYTITLEE